VQSTRNLFGGFDDGVGQSDDLPELSQHRRRRQTVYPPQHPFRFQQNGLGNEYSGGSREQRIGALGLSLVVIGEVTHQDIGVDCDHGVFCCSSQSWRMSSEIPWSISSMVIEE
jgi:hypothetical protein